MELGPNRKLFPDQLSSILHGALVGLVHWVKAENRVTMQAHDITLHTDA